MAHPEIEFLALPLGADEPATHQACMDHDEGETQRHRAPDGVHGQPEAGDGAGEQRDDEDVGEALHRGGAAGLERLLALGGGAIAGQVPGRAAGRRRQGSRGNRANGIEDRVDAPRADGTQQGLRGFEGPLPPQEQRCPAVGLVVLCREHSDHDVEEVDGEDSGSEDHQRIPDLAAPDAADALQAVLVTQHQAPVHAHQQIAPVCRILNHDVVCSRKSQEARRHDAQHRENAPQGIVHGQDACAEHVPVPEQHDELEGPQDDGCTEQGSQGWPVLRVEAVVAAAAEEEQRPLDEVYQRRPCVLEAVEEGRQIPAVRKVPPHLPDEDDRIVQTYRSAQRPRKPMDFHAYCTVCPSPGHQGAYRDELQDLLQEHDVPDEPEVCKADQGPHRHLGENLQLPGPRQGVEHVRSQHIRQQQHLDLDHVVALDVALRGREVPVPRRLRVRPRGIQEPAGPLPAVLAAPADVGLVVREQGLDGSAPPPPRQPGVLPHLEVRVHRQGAVGRVLDVRGHHENIGEQPHAGARGALDDRGDLIHRRGPKLVGPALHGHTSDLVEQHLLLVPEARRLGAGAHEHEVQQLCRELVAAGRETAQVVEQGEAAVLVGAAEAEHVRDGVRSTLRAAREQQRRLLKDRVRQRHVGAALGQEAGEGAPAVQNGVVEAGAAEPVWHIRIRLSRQQELASLVVALGRGIQQRSVVRLRVVGDHGLHGGARIQKQRQRRGGAPGGSDVHGGAAVRDAPRHVVRPGVHVCRGLQDEPHDGLGALPPLLLQAHRHVRGEMQKAPSQQLLGSLVEPSLRQRLQIHVVHITACQGGCDAAREVLSGGPGAAAAASTRGVG
mmetsp:Transcript_51589/g.167537  ORF Transcript_51589/g.167537 Transcript_51589/m.167537 type:complete len:836 (+) Transcript_51589:260-2767(+)